MKNRVQILVSVSLLVGAVAVVAFQLRSGEAPAQADGGMDGHDHAAMMAGSQEQSPVQLTAADARRIGVTFAQVERKALRPTIQTLGTVAWDETRLSTVSPKIEGWVEELHVEFTGAPVEAGQPLMSVYSPRLVSAQEELALAARLLREAPEGRARDNARALVESSRRRLEYWDVPEDEIRRVEETGEPRKALTLRAPATGVVVEKNVVEGARIAPGMSLFRVADLSRVWVEADVFEKDLGLVGVGQTAQARFKAYPGRVFPARVTYVYPTVSLESRTGRIRLELDNPERALKPGMYADVTLDVPPTAPTLVLPRSAVLSTGTRSLVFVESEDGSLTPTEVTTGRTVGREVEILAGLTAGQHVVSSGAFLVDAESNLGALTAGMDMEEDAIDHSEHDMGGAPMDDTMDHSEHEMGGAPMDDAMDHSGHEMAPDSAPAGGAGGHVHE